MVRRFLGWLSLSALLSASLTAQQNATVQGVVVDESKGVMPGVVVTASEISTGRQSVVVTEADGRYRLDNLPPGKYRLRIELSGFATAEINDIDTLRLHGFGFCCCCQCRRRFYRFRSSCNAHAVKILSDKKE